jgi:uncharacterized membrane-anchored protein
MPAWLARPLVLALLVALLQTGALAAMILDRARLIATGREIVLPTVPVDPRSLFRGDYVILNYEISTVPAADLVAKPGNDGDSLYVLLERRRKDGAENWAPISASRSRPQATGADRIVLAGWQVGQVRNNQTPSVRVRYGIESYFVPEGTGKDLEARVRAEALSVIVAVGSGGQAAIKGLVLDGKTRYDEPLF